MGKLLWSPIEEQKSQSEINKFEQGYQLSFALYHDLLAWSTITDFWQDVATYFTIKFHFGFCRVLAHSANRDSFFGSTWSSGSTLNYA